MRIKLDENMPHALVSALSRLGHDVDTVIDEGLAAARDHLVWDAAQQEKRLLITQDLDFSDARRFSPGTHCGIVLIRLRDPSRTALTERVRLLFASESGDDWFGCIVIVSRDHFRVRRPPPHAVQS